MAAVFRQFPGGRLFQFRAAGQPDCRTVLQPAVRQNAGLISGQPLPAAELAWDKVFFGELHRIGYLLLRLLPLLLLFAIPVVNLLAPLLWAGFAAWGMALEFMAYPLEQRGLAFAGQKQFLQQVRWGALSFGGLTSLGLTLPLVNLLIGQAAVIGATIYVYRLSANTSDTP